MIDYQECFRYYIKLLRISDEHTTHEIVQWYQETCRFYETSEQKELRYEWLKNYRIGY